MRWWHWSLAGGLSAGVLLVLLTGEPVLFALGFIGGALVAAFQYRVWGDEYRESERRWREASPAERRRQVPERTRALRRGAALLAGAVAALLGAMWIAGSTPGPQAALLFAPPLFLYAAARYIDARGS